MAERKRSGSKAPMGRKRKDTARPAGPAVSGTGAARPAKHASLVDALRRSEEQYRLLVEAANSVILTWDTSGTILFVNAFGERLFGFSKDELIGRSVVGTIVPETDSSGRDLAALMQEIQHDPDRFMDNENENITKEGRRVWVRWANKAMLDAEGRLTGILSVGHDITLRKQREEALRASEERWRSLVETSSAWIWETDAAIRHTYTNAFVSSCLGYQTSEFLNIEAKTLVHADDHPLLEEIVRSAAMHGSRWSGKVLRWRHKDGSWKYIESSGTPVFDRQGVFSGLRGVDRDITESKMAVDLLRMSEERFRRLFDESPMSLWEEDFSELIRHFDDLRAKGVTDAKSYFASRPEEVIACIGKIRVISVNRATLRLYEAPDQTTILQGLGRVFTMESLEGFRSILESLFRGAEQHECEAVNQTLTGRKLHVLLRCSVLPRTGSVASRALISIVDITERKHMEELLRQNEETYRLLFDASTDGIFILGMDGRFIDVNRTAYERLGYTREELLSMNIRQLDDPQYAPRVPERLRQIREQGVAVFESGHRRKNGTMMPVEVNSRLLVYKGETVFYSVIRDITERKRMEQALKDSEELYRNLVETTAAVAWEIDTSSLRFTYISPQVEELSGFPAEHWTDFAFWADRIYPGDRDEAVRFCRAETAKGLDHAFEYRMVRADGGTVWVRDVVSVIKEQDRPVTLRGYFINITASKNAEERIRQSEQFIRSILDSVDEGFIVVDREYRILTANKAYCALAGLSDDEAVGRHCYEISHKSSRPCFEAGEECAVREVFASGKASLSLHRHPGPDGRVLYVETKAYPVKDAEGRVTSVIETINNITEKHLLEEERLKTQKLESIGTLAGGIAHDFNNLLQGVFGYISLAKKSLDQPERSLAMLEQAEKALQSSVGLTSQLLTFSKGGRPVRKRIDIAPVVENSAKFALSGSRSGLTLDIFPDLWAVDADSGQIGQVVQNIVLNADQAMPGGGKVVITARNLFGNDALLPQALAGRDHVLVTVSDTGIGISEENIGRIFDPYFTTKEKGNGLGLATAYSIIRNHDGLITFQSKAGKGTTFLLYLPAAAGVAEERAQAPAAAASARSGRVLVMDDEEIVRMVAGELIRELGHEPVFAEDGETAVRLYEEAWKADRTFDAVILDLTIRGGMGGVEAVKRLRAIDPNVRTVVSSGYSDDSVVANYRDHGFQAFLKKPYDIDDLRRVLGALID